MTTITKSRGTAGHWVDTGIRVDKDTHAVDPVFRTYYPDSTNRITYETGPRYVDGANRWKYCKHEQLNFASGNILWLQAVQSSGSRTYWYPGLSQLDRYAQQLPSLPGKADVARAQESAMMACVRQLDLNIQDTVMLYSGVIQALPFLGAATKLATILNQAAKQFSKRARRQPFTTVVRSLISADFVDRFVISPMIDDARKFHQAVDHCLNIIGTAHERNARKLIPLQGESSVVSYSSSSSYWDNYDYGGIKPYIEREFRAEVTTKTAILVQASYDTNAIDPVKLWAHRVGLTAPLGSVWDLVPFSFVIDYFFRAGDFVSAVDNELGHQDALVARIGGIADAWQMTTTEATVRARATDCRMASSFDRVELLVPGNFKFGTRVFERTRVGQAGAWLNTIQDSDDFLNVRLSNTRLRTLFELWCQAKTK